MLNGVTCYSKTWNSRFDSEELIRSMRLTEFLSFFRGEKGKEKLCLPACMVQFLHSTYSGSSLQVYPSIIFSLPINSRSIQALDLKFSYYKDFCSFTYYTDKVTYASVIMKLFLL